MNPHDTSVKSYVKAFSRNWLSGMSGALSVPFSVAAVWLDGRFVKTVSALLAVAAFSVASYKVWRDQLNDDVEQVLQLSREHGLEIASMQEVLAASQRRSEEVISALQEQIAVLARKPYTEELRSQTAELIAKLSPQGRSLLRHLVVNEPLDMLSRFKPEIDPAAQSGQMALACDSGIVRRDIVHNGLGNILAQNYVINPKFRPVLEDLLYK